MEASPSAAAVVARDDGESKKAPPVASSSSSSSSSVAWHVHKFGGTSVANAACFERVRAIFEKQQRPGHPVAMVLSAMGGSPRKTTDVLLDAVSQAARQDVAGYEAGLEGLRESHAACVAELRLPAAVQAALLATITRDL